MKHIDDSALAAPLIVAIGGTMRAGSTTELAMRKVLTAAQACGAVVECFAGPELELPLYTPGRRERTPAARRLVTLLRRADGIVLASPGYHGSISGAVKNALDYTEDLRDDERPYFDGRAVASIATGGGWQGAVNTLTALRCIVHALRGWNTPMGAAINTSTPLFAPDGLCLDAKLDDTLQELGETLVRFAQSQRRRSGTRALASAA